MNALKEGWFSELSTMWPGECFSLKVKQVLHEEKSKFQDILVFDSENYGRVLVLDGVIQQTERDECAYQEMMAHIPLAALKTDPKKVCVIGGGDGGVVREILKHPSVEEVHLCEIDEGVVNASKKFLPHMNMSFESPKLKLHIYDGAVFLKEHKNCFDVVIVDSSDPVGPASSLFGPEFYKSCKEALNENGILCTQAESMWLHLDIIAGMKDFIVDIFPNVSYSTISIPTYPSGAIGFFICSKDESNDVKVAKRTEWFESAKDTLQYYNPGLHASSFVLPLFASRRLGLKQ
ncbi:predicted protein [Naegleria gruberi]|uniref:Predicted protein n=1 Tax=Naegleria gruberi TaxID=5762 RepID=D2UYF4_NAEGR|nr:uncharacterized protein NAEGRDRAFT_55563 [Naegleria gruberi]EFC50783.1 predicted protein [Naegleria gruberi]|eukprot:XP_002683527.1 predicted protein [Naegleria gruberi strain NEG-M]